MFGGDSEVLGEREGTVVTSNRATATFAGSIPSRVSSTETLYAWHMRRRHVLVDRWALARFVFYRAPARGPPAGLDDRDAPDAGLGLSPFNPSERGDFRGTNEAFLRCGGKDLS